MLRNKCILTFLPLRPVHLHVQIRERRKIYSLHHYHKILAGLADTAHFADSKKKDDEQKETKKEKTIPKKESNNTEPMEESSHGRW